MSGPSEAPQPVSPSAELEKWELRRTISQTLVPPIAVVATLLAAIVAWSVASSEITARRAVDVRNDRVAAYTAYVGDVEEFVEFIWNQAYWMGSEEKNLRPGNLGEDFWRPAQSLSSRVAASRAGAKLHAGDQEILASIESIYDYKRALFIRVKCLAGVAAGDECSEDLAERLPSCGVPETVPGSTVSNADVRNEIIHWQGCINGEVERLLETASSQVK